MARARLSILPDVIAERNIALPLIEADHSWKAGQLEFLLRCHGSLEVRETQPLKFRSNCFCQGDTQDLQFAVGLIGEIDPMVPVLRRVTEECTHPSTSDHLDTTLRTPQMLIPCYKRPI